VGIWPQSVTSEKKILNPLYTGGAASDGLGRGGENIGARERG